ncbi:hypothetical protein CMO90_01410 [Candidatus Woesearchaeota archaeon]|mgnify:CR=1 FL=1|jgi:uncharacterized RDD family membrane protein YckC|nr:hypothetical protein [Candidatus Woesearchaeota archaeon]
MDLKLPKKRLLKRDAPILKRLASFIFDLLIINIIIISPFQKVFPITTNSSLTEMIAQIQQLVGTNIYISLFFISILILAYFTVFQLKLAQTPGMMLLKLKVEGKLTIAKTILRNIFVIPFFPFFILWIVEPIHLLIRGHRFLEEVTKTKTIEEIKY